MRNLVDRDLSHRRRGAVARRSHSTGLEYGLIAAALAVAIVTVVAGLSARYGAAANSSATAIERNIR
jgi:pilus assembly protein Flp/PilA